jgi:hypothetical protein
MAIPDFQTLMLPVLKQFVDGTGKRSGDLRAPLAIEFALTPEEIAQRFARGVHTVFGNRIAWAITYLKRAVILESPRRGLYTITQRGSDVLKKSPTQLDSRYLDQFPEFVASKKASSASESLNSDDSRVLGDGSEELVTPHESPSTTTDEQVIAGNARDETSEPVSVNPSTSETRTGGRHGMKTQKYAVNQYLIESVLSKVREGEIAIPEIQRPFVWDSSQVRDLLDSLYQGFPIGYLIAWRNPDVRLKDGSTASGKMILIDGQQRVTALAASMLGQLVVNKSYKRVRIAIAFHPVQERFEVQNPAILKDVAWVPDVAPVLSGDIKLIKAVNQYLTRNPGANADRVEEALSALTDIPKKQIGLIELSNDLDIETVTEIFIRINSKGTVLSQADFAMSKIASDSRYGGPVLRKCIDYFSHLAVAPEFYSQIKENDDDFTKTDYFGKISWLKDEKDDLYDPGYTDILRVAFTTEFNRGKLADLVSLLSGRNFETKVYEDAITEDTFARLKNSVLNFVNESHFKRFVLAIKSAGFVSNRMIRSQNALNAAYIVYLKLRSQKVPDQLIEGYVRRWFVLSVLTGRYSGSPESQFDTDIRQMSAGDFGKYLITQEEADLSPAFWEVGLVQQLDTAQANSPQFWVWVASQVKGNAHGFLSRDTRVQELVCLLGDIHHVFPKDALKKAGMDKGLYNQIANYAFAQEEINIKVSNKPPTEYLAGVRAQCESGSLKYGSINDLTALKANLAENSIPESIFETGLDHYEDFLAERRKLMAGALRNYYASL